MEVAKRIDAVFDRLLDSGAELAQVHWGEPRAAWVRRWSDAANFLARATRRVMFSTSDSANPPLRTVLVYGSGQEPTHQHRGRDLLGGRSAAQLRIEVLGDAQVHRWFSTRWR
ncbi:MAG: hypothetical protein ACRDRZ_01780 [Pseudonocardiaceae bacterium]